MVRNKEKIRSQAERFAAGELSRGAKLLADEIEKSDMKSDMTQVEAARRLGCHPGFLSHMLRGRKMPSRTMAIKIQNIFGVAVEAWDE